MSQISGAALFVAALALGGGIAGGGFFVGQTMVNREHVNTADVKGLSERMVVADQAIWQIGFKVANADLKAGYGEVESNAAAIRAFLTRNGFDAASVSGVQTSVTENEFRDGNGVLTEKRYDIVATISVTTGDVKAVDAAYQKLGELIAQGLLLTDSQPRYLFTGLNAVKPDMLREATENARIAAGEFAKNAGISVGSIRSATQGGFEVRDLNSGEYGTDDRSIAKQVRVVTTVTFYLD